MKVGIVGVGAVGKAMTDLFPGCAVYDEPKGIGSRAEVNAADIAFVSVPTPRAVDGSSDTSIVEEVVSWLEAPTIVLRSTVSVGTTRRLAATYGKDVVFQPEYGPAETPDHPFNDLRNIRWVILGGERQPARRVLRAWQSVYSSDLAVRFTTWEAAELAKYMENAYLALKVTFCNEFFEIAQRVGVDYDELRELWLMDPRMGKSHTWVLPDKRGFGGRCLPKDLDAIIRTAESLGHDPALLRQVARSNEAFRADPSAAPSRDARTPATSRAGR
ncbi:MAG: UDP-glucose/GDP-mannose dehydrogenase family protein [Elusimicrobia bacterium]|nr:UDP-glucose/GDP-mannose dehydrogenase family protein [Elusimicrobiota bacterium]